MPRFDFKNQNEALKCFAIGKPMQNLADLKRVYVRSWAATCCGIICGMILLI